jgi:pimeloyl-ACP methyl ester carboxylesterase
MFCRMQQARLLFSVVITSPRARRREATMTSQREVEEGGGRSAGHNTRGRMLAAYSTVRYDKPVMQIGISEEMAGEMENPSCSSMAACRMNARRSSTLPPEYFERWVEAADTMFQNDAPGVMSWSFSAAEAARTRQPFLNVTAASTGTHLGAVYSALRSWVPHAENVELPNATHCMLQSNPKGAADLLADFFARHPLHA